MLLITIIISVVVIAHVLAIAIVVDSIKRKDAFTMKRFIAITTTIMLTVFLMINFINQYKEEQRILNYQLTVQETVSMYINDNKFATDTEVASIYDNIALAYCKEHNLKEVPELIIYEEDRYGLYHKDGKYDKKKNIIYLNRRTKGVVQTLENETKAEVVKAILYLLNK